MQPCRSQKLETQEDFYKAVRQIEESANILNEGRYSPEEIEEKKDRFLELRRKIAKIYELLEINWDIKMPPLAYRWLEFPSVEVILREATAEDYREEAIFRNFEGPVSFESWFVRMSARYMFQTYYQKTLCYSCPFSRRLWGFANDNTCNIQKVIKEDINTDRLEPRCGLVRRYGWTLAQLEKSVLAVGGPIWLDQFQRHSKTLS